MPTEIARRKRTAVILSLAVLFAVLFLLTDPWGVLRRDHRRIRLEDPDSVDVILIARQGDTIRLERERGIWWLGLDEPADPVAVENLLYAASRLQVTSVLTTGPEVEKGLPARLFFYGEKEQLMAFEFMASGRSYLVRPLGGERAYHVTLPGYDDPVLEQAFTGMAAHYRERLLIDLLPSEIAGLQIEHASGRSVLFTRDPQGGITASPPEGSAAMPAGSMDTLAVRMLFSYLTGIRYERRAGVPADSLLEDPWKNHMMARLWVESACGETHHLRVFPLRKKPGGEPHMFLALVAYNDWEDALVVNYIHLDVLMRDPAVYFEE